MKLKTVLLVPVLVGLSAYGAVKGYLHYRITSDLEQLSALAEPYAEIRYDTIATGLIEGSVALEGLRVTPSGAAESVTVDRIELSGDGPGFLFGLAAGWRAERPPEQLQLVVNRARSPVTADYLAIWAVPGQAVAPAVCSLGGLLGQQGLERLGFQQLVADARLNYHFQPSSGRLSMRLDLVHHGLSHGNFEVELDGLRGPAEVVAGVPPALRRLTLGFQFDAGYLQRAVDDCATREGLSRQDYIERLLAVDDATWMSQLGFVPGTGLRFALQQLIGEAAELVIDARPAAPINPALLSAYRPQQLVEVLGVNLRAAGQTVSDLSFTLPAGTAASGGLAGVAPSASGVVSPGQDAGARPERPRARFLDTPLDQLRRYVGRDVRVHTTDRPQPQKGILVALQNGQLDLEQRLYGGKMTLYIPLREIRRVEVYRRE